MKNGFIQAGLLLLSLISGSTQALELSTHEPLQPSQPSQPSKQVQVAVASNFSKPLEAIAAEFKADKGYEVLASAGATGKLYAQIENGAPFEVFIAADSKTPKKLVDNNYAIADSQFTYALGQLVLWSSSADYVDDKGEVLRKGTFKHLAIANPKTAPYGTAALEVLDKMGLSTLSDKFVQGENISQTFDFVQSGNAELGFVAMSQVSKDGKINTGSGWIIPEDQYSALVQDAVILNKGKDNPAAAALMEYLKGDKAQAIMRNYGYRLPTAKPTP